MNYLMQKLSFVLDNSISGSAATHIRQIQSTTVQGVNHSHISFCLFHIFNLELKSLWTSESDQVQKTLTQNNFYHILIALFEIGGKGKEAVLLNVTWP